MAIAIAVFAALLCYAGVDRSLRCGALGGKKCLAWLVPALSALAPFWSWQTLSDHATFRWVAWGLASLLAWNAATRDVDLVNPGPGGWLRVLLMFSALSSFASPAWLLVTAALLSGRFHFWQHHAAFPMRVLQSFVAFVLLSTLLGMVRARLPNWLNQSSLEAGFMLWLTLMMVSHYVITALAKTLLGPKPWSWMIENRLHYLPASAYSWGWARFVPWPQFRRVVALVRCGERPLQVIVFTVELTVPFALLDQNVAIAYSLVFAGFHLGVLVLSGLFFWDWMLTDLLLAWLLAMAPAELATRAFGVVPFIVGCTVLGLFPLRHRLWKPMPLGWYDSPFTQRVHWQVTGKSGKTYGLYNNFMCPHERLYGKVHGAFAVEHEVLTYHLGELFKLDLRDALVEAGPDLERLADVRRRFGVQPKSRELTERHEKYLRGFCAALNRGEKKSILPRWARWLKAPGDQLFYWGELEAYRRQEPITRVRLVYREEFFNGHDLVRLIEEELLAFGIDEAPPEPVQEMTPREMDGYLLDLAAGRLIDLPGFKKAYTAGDDQVGKLART